ncbi:MAG: T9SS type A sorting domain-containing protein [Bacteroidetes bacterium]|jgi:subtilisin-like proprotein convertase family protein|nr:T9SS type A sorting domain-containing protein [Bacteroidota bacterium]
MMKTFLSLICGLLCLTAVQAQQNFWQPAEAKGALHAEQVRSTMRLTNFKSMQLDFDGLRIALADAPQEYTQAAQTAAPEVMLPMPDGRLEAFSVVYSPIMAPGLAARYPNIATFKVYSQERPAVSGRIGFGPDRFHAFLQTPEGGVFIDPLYKGASEFYSVFYTADVDVPAHIAANLACGFEAGSAGLGHKSKTEQLETRSLDAVSLYKYTFGLATSGEFASYHGASTKQAVMQKVVEIMNRSNQVLENDVAVRLELAENTDDAFFLSTNDDPFNDGSDVPNSYQQTPTILNEIIGQDNYDIGHSFIAFCGGGVVGIGGGNACNENLNSGNFKGFGISCQFEQNDLFAVEIVCHEVGHQLSASHTFNNCENNEPNITEATAYEPGGGSTIMSYTSACGSQTIQSSADPYFHSANVEQILQYTRVDAGSGCAEVIAVENNAPTVTLSYTDGFRIPIETPFELTAAGSDPDGDDITYCWEQFDLGPLSPVGSPIMNAPIFRSFLPTSSPTRVFPRLDKIINNDFDNSEVLPAYGRDLTFRCTVRDNHEEAGGTAWQEVRFRAAGNAGPFLVTAPNESMTMNAGDYTEITWDVANTDRAPVNCQYVDVLLSVDGGFTYPYTLTAGTPNDGSVMVNLPADVVTDEARIRVQASDNIFFDISDADFTIEPAQEPGFTAALAPVAFPLVCLPAEELVVNISTDSLLGFDSTLTLSLIGGLPQGAAANFDNDQILPGESTNLRISIPQLAVRDTFDLQVDLSAEGFGTESRELRIVAQGNDFSALQLMTPEDGTADIVISTIFTWVDVPNADEYEFQLATSPAFGDSTIYSEVGVLDASDFVPDDLELERNNFFYWRVRPINDCGTGPWAPTSVFRTASTDCIVYQPTDLPINVPSQPNVKQSRILIQEEGTITDINISDVDISFTPINALRLTLESPIGTRAVLFDQDCLNTGLLRVGFDDEAPSGVNCPPISFALAQPEEPLSTFDGENTAGEWNLELEVVNEGSSTGNFRDWNIEFCGTTVPPKPNLLVNETLFVPPGESNIITTEQLAASDDNYGPSQVKFRLIETPEHGTLLRGGEPLVENDHFLQVTIDGFNLSYQHDGSDAVTDEFRFIVENPEEGFIPVQTFRIEVDEDAVVSTKVVEVEQSFTLFPNPASNEVLLQMERPTDAPAQVMLTNLQGQLLQQRAFPQGERQLSLETANLPQGIYLVILQSADSRKAEKLIIQR